jgi:hypothetical protein
MCLIVVIKKGSPFSQQASYSNINSADTPQHRLSKNSILLSKSTSICASNANDNIRFLKNVSRITPKKSCQSPE